MSHNSKPNFLLHILLIL